MSDIRERLQRFGVLPNTAVPSKPEETPNFSWPEIHEIIPGQLVQTQYGKCFVTSKKWSCDTVHGGVEISELKNYCGSHLRMIAGDEPFLCANIDLETIGFIDTETTGLAGGTGTYPFLVGVGFFKDSAFYIRQYFMSGPQDEPAMIHLLDELFSGFKATATFNGKAFDLPILRTRFIMNRREFPLKDAFHIDLLPPARRLWKMRLASRALSSLEQNILGIIREDDIPGALIPGLYFDYLKNKNPFPMRPVFKHNTLDVLSMVSLTIRMASILADPDMAGVYYGEDWYCLARYYDDLGFPDKALDAYKKTLSAPCPPDIYNTALQNISLFHKRRDQWNEAVSIWYKMIESNKSNHVYPYEELAKYYEHKQYKYEIALRFVEEAIDGIESGRIKTSEPSCFTIAELRHRLYRLQRKLQGQDQNFNTTELTET